MYTFYTEGVKSGEAARAAALRDVSMFASLFAFAKRLAYCACKIALRFYAWGYYNIYTFYTEGVKSGEAARAAAQRDVSMFTSLFAFAKS